MVGHEVLAAMQETLAIPRRGLVLVFAVGHYSNWRFDLNRLGHLSSRLTQNDLAASRNAALSYNMY
jgi:hypothetical protein